MLSWTRLIQLIPPHPVSLNIHVNTIHPPSSSNKSCIFDTAHVWLLVNDKSKAMPSGMEASIINMSFARANIGTNNIRDNLMSCVFLIMCVVSLTNVMFRTADKKWYSKLGGGGCYAEPTIPACGDSVTIYTESRKGQAFWTYYWTWTERTLSTVEVNNVIKSKKVKLFLYEAVVAHEVVTCRESAHICRWGCQSYGPAAL
jgi:hypothetical protein